MLRFLQLFFLLISTIFFLNIEKAFAQNMTSDSGYEIIDPTISAGGNDDQTSTTGTYRLRESIGVPIMDERFESANYKLEAGTGYTFEAYTPSISYFQTSDAMMENICGHGGCYDRARFELDNATRMYDSSTLGMWRLDEQAGTGAYLLDISGNDNHGTPTGTSYTSDGKVGGARSFTGDDSGDVINAGTDSSLYPTDEFTISAWVYVNSGPSTQGRTIASTYRYVSNTEYYGWQFGTLWTGTSFSFSAYEGSTTTTAYTSISNFYTTYQYEWVHLAGVYKGGEYMRLYLNGTLVNTDTSVPEAVVYYAGDPFTIGRRSAQNQSYWDGYIDEVNYSGVARSTEEIQMDYNFGLGTHDNPYDTLYLIEISDDDWTTVQYVDGSTHSISSTKDINDYLTESEWESGPWSEENIIGLTPGTEYKVRARALNGDFTETEAGSSLTATTAVPQIYVDLNISGGTWSSTSAPYSVDMGVISKTFVTTAADYIWIDLGTNALSGATISVRDLYDGLYSAIGNYTIDSQSEDLSSQDEGFGFKIDTSKRLPASGQPGYLRESTTYNTTGADEVGAISSTPSIILCSIKETAGNCSTGTGTPVHEGRSALWIKARAAFATPSSIDYTDTITFSALGSF